MTCLDLDLVMLSGFQGDMKLQMPSPPLGGSLYRRSASVTDMPRSARILAGEGPGTWPGETSIVYQ